MSSGASKSVSAGSGLLEVLLETVDSGILVCDVNGNLTFHNLKARELLGWPDSLRPATYADLDPISAAALRQALTVDSSSTPEAIGLAQSLATMAKAFYDDSGVKAGAILVLNDTSGEPRIAEVLEMTNDAFMMLDREWRYTYLNAKAVELAGKHRDALIGHSVWAEFPEAVSRPFYSELHRAAAENEPRHFESYYPPMGKWFENDAYPSPAGVSIFYRDITERKRIEADLRRNAEELARSNDDLQQFTYAISHDLQEPLRTVNTYTQMLEKRLAGKLDAESEELMTGITDSARRMRDMIRDLLVFSRVAQGGSDADWFGPVNMEEVLEWAAENLRIAIAESGAVITNDPLPTVPGVELQMRQLFQNLIGNALKYRSAEPLQIHIGAENEGETCLFSFRDNGIGIPARQMERIFGLFQRGHAGGKHEGTGVGLALCRRIALRHHGTLEVKSEPGKGSTFYLRLPAAS